MFSTKSGKILKSSLIFTLVFFVIFIISLPFFVKSMVDSRYIKQEISRFILKKTGIKVSQGKMIINFFPRPYLKIDGIKTEFNIYGRKNGRKNNRETVKKTDNDSKSRKKAINLIIETAKFYPDLKTLMHTRGKNISGTLLIKKILADHLTKKSKIPIAENIKSFSIDYLKIIFTYKTTGHLKASITCEHPELILKNKKTAPISGKKLKAVIDVAKNNIQLTIKNFILDYPAMDLSVKYLNDENLKNTSLEFSGSKVNVDQTKKISLALFKGDEISNEIFKIVRSGNADDLTVSFHGKNLKTLFYEKNMLIRGKLTNGSIGIPATKLVTNKTWGNALVKNGVLHIYVKHGRIGNSSFKKAKLKINLLDRTFPFQGTFPIDADLGELAGILKRLLPDSDLEHELNLCSKIRGRAKGVLTLAKIKKKKPLSISVQADDINLEALYARLPEEISIKGGKFTYADNSLIMIDKLNGSIGKSQFSNLHASIELTNQNVLEIKSGRAVIAAGEIFPWLISFTKIESAVFPLKSVTGTVNINSFNLKGPVMHPGQWQYDINGTCSNIVLGKESSKKSKESKKEISSLSFGFKISDKIKSFSDINTQIYKTDLLTSFVKTDFLDDIALPLSLSKAELSFKDKNIYFQGNILFKTGPEIILKIKTPTDNRKDGQALKKLLNFSMKLGIKDKNMSDAVISYAGSTGQQQGHLNFKGRFDTRTIKKILAPDSRTIKNFFALTNNENFIAISNEESGLTVLTDTLNIDALSRIHRKDKSDEDNKNRSDKNNLYSAIIFPLNFTIKANRLIYKTMVFSPFEAEIDVDHNIFTILLESTKLCGISITGIIDKNNKINLSLKLYTKKGNLEQFTSCMLNKKKLIKGQYTIDVDLDSEGNMYQLMNNLHGKINFSSSKGRIYRLTLLSRILSVINISKFIRGKIPDILQNGFAYNSMIVKADIKNNRILLKSAVIKGVDMTFIFKGEIDMLNKTTELKCLVSPFKTADLIIKNIPILGHILNNQLVSIPVEITGSIDNPDIFLLPPSEVGKELINMMGRILSTPFRIIKSLPQ